MNKTKKKILVSALAICLIAVVSFSTLAYFTDTDSVKNTFTVGSIKIEQIEEDGSGNPFQQDQIMLPIVNTTDPTADDNYINKVVTVKSTGENEAYVRTFIAVDARIAPYIHLDLNAGTGSKWVREADQTATYTDQAGVTQTLKVLVFTYQDMLAKNIVTEELLKGVYMAPEVDVKDFGGVQQFCTWDGTQYVSTGYNVADGVNVYVATQGVQAKGFADAKTALDTAFGTTVPSFQ